MNSIANLEAAEKIVHLFAKDYNATWIKLALRGIADEDTKVKLNKGFTEKYGTTKNKK